MSRSKPTLLALGLMLGLSTQALAQETFNAPEDLSKVKPQQLCVHYSEQSEADKKRFFARLDQLNLLSHKDYDLIPKGQVEVGSTMCGMYMGLGKPLQEQGMQIRPMVFKVVHVYPEHYIVTQSGVVMEMHARKEGEMPPTLNQAAPKVAPPPIAPH